MSKQHAGRASCALILAIVSMSTCMQASGVESKSVPLQLLVPAYFYPSASAIPLWNEMVIAARHVPLVVIVNPANGPGNAQDANYFNVTQKLRKAGAQVIGYVPTNYGKRNRGAVFRDLIWYRDLYQIDGYFIDEMANNETEQSRTYYLDLYASIKALGSQYRVVGNPGTPPNGPTLYDDVSDALVTLEQRGNQAELLLEGLPLRKAVPQLGMLAYEVSRDQDLSRLVRAAAGKGIKLLYLTDDSSHPNPWDSLPTYWRRLVRLVCEYNASTNCPKP